MWKKSNTEIEVRNLQPSVKHRGGSVMIWVCMHYAGAGKLHFIHG